MKNLDDFPNLTIKKIPKTVLARCEWGHDDYSLEIANLPTKTPEPDESSAARSVGVELQTKVKRRARVEPPSLFDNSNDNGGGK